MPVVGEGDNNKLITVRVGEPILIRLKSNPRTGYDWYRVGFERLRNQSDKEFIISKDYIYPLIKMFGVPGVSEFTVEPIKTGRYDLNLVYRRVFEPASERDKRFTLRVNVE